MYVYDELLVSRCDTVKLREVPYSLIYQVEAETRLMAGVMT
jgi:hypothetical protein